MEDLGTSHFRGLDEAIQVAKEGVRIFNCQIGHLQDKEINWAEYFGGIS